jgi:transcription-repair coupling factor (superfamily II helicase)
MNLNTLLGFYQNDDRLKQLAAGISLPDPKLRVSLNHLRGSSVHFIAAAVWHLSDVNHVFVLNDKEEASYFQNDLENLTAALDIFLFPDSFKKAGSYGELNSSHIMLRTEALSKLDDHAHKKVLVTYPDALMEKVVNNSALSKNKISIKTGELLQVEELLLRFTDLGFHREDFVYEPGQFAMRGGILDIYSFGNEHPYRIELFGNEVDSIRIFNPETQLSERKLLYVSILPNIETKFETEEKVSLLDYLPANTAFWFKDMEFCSEKMKYIAATLPEKLSNDITVSIDPEEQWLKELSIADFENVSRWMARIEQFHLLQWNGQNIVKGQDTIRLDFSTEPQPVFNRNFALLTADLQQKIQAGYQPYIFAENARQLERLRSIFEDSGAQVHFVPVPTSISAGFIDEEKKIVAYTDHQIFQRFHKYKVKQAYSKGQAITLRALRELQPGDFVVHIDHGIGRYSGLQKIEVNGAMQEAVRIIYRDNDVLYVNINSLHKISKHTGKEGTVPKINKLGSDTWEKLKNKTKKQVRDIAADLIKLYAKRKASPGFAHSPDNYMQTELESSFIYEDTPDQSKAVADVKRDMEAPAPMDRLVCGDVGFGKTEVAVRAAFKTVGDSKQAAILVPTTILAYQHYQTFSERLKEFPATVDFINRFKSARDKKETFKKLEEGKIDIIIGTHALLGKDVRFKDLGLLVIDEEQKFGVSAKEKLRERKANVDTLTLTATPIPRTLQFSLMSARDLSIINTPPPNRQPVHTEVLGFDERFIRDAIYYETERGGQVYFIHNRVQSLPGMAEKIKELCPDLEIAVAHGQMEGNRLEKTLLDFIGYKYDVLCCTNIVESGVDIANANTIFINNAHQFGLSDLHQLRGRVGRSNKKAFCYLLAPSLVTLPADSRKRLQALEQFNELGSGFQIAMRDLDIRGAGDLLGGEQSGFITDIGFETYQKILAEAMRELKSTDFKDLFAEELERKNDYVFDCTLDTDLEILIPDDYVENIGERLSLYTQLDNIEEEGELLIFEEELKDRFGPLPRQVTDLLTAVRCRETAKELGFEKLILKNKVMRLYFVSNPESPYFETTKFHHILDYIQTQTNMAKLKQSGKNCFLTVANIKDMNDVERFLKGMAEEANSLKVSS